MGCNATLADASTAAIGCRAQGHRFKGCMVTTKRIHCPFCGTALACPIPVPEVAICHVCGTQLRLRSLLETAVFPATVGVSVQPAEPPPAAQLAERMPPPAYRRAGLSLIIAGVLGVMLSGVSAVWMIESIRFATAGGPPPPPDATTIAVQLLFCTMNTVAGVLIAAGGVYAVASCSTGWAIVGSILTFMPIGGCCVVLVPFGVFALANVLLRDREGL